MRLSYPYPWGSMVDEGCFNPWCVGPLGLGQIKGGPSTGAYDPGRDCDGLPGLKTISRKTRGLSPGIS